MYNIVIQYFYRLHYLKKFLKTSMPKFKTAEKEQQMFSQQILTVYKPWAKLLPQLNVSG